ncbi:MAG: D-sedoheptulose 7-phosphate isomerase [Burkholderiales bacterium]|nr:D-sedoheptulose 7-phosphate isomerase [Burkholderiales bacterium]
MNDSTFLSNLNEHMALCQQLGTLDTSVSQAIQACVQSLQKGGKLMLCGNGGSAADSQHLAAEFTGRFSKDRPPIAAVALSTDTSALTCIGNDYSFNDIFARQVQALGKAGDCLIAISTSGNSGNVLAAVAAAKSLGISTIGLLGRDGGKLKAQCDISIVVPSQVTARIQEAHILIGHSLCGAVELKLGMVSAD